MITTEITYACDGSNCDNKVTKSGAGVSKRSVRIEARKAGWLIKGSKVALCPTHRPAKAPKKERKAKAAPKPGSKASIAKKLTSLVKGKKASTSSKKATPFVGGQSIGIKARSAKVEAAPAAE